MRFALPIALIIVGAGVTAQEQSLVEARRQMADAAARHDVAGFAALLTDDVTSVDRAGWLRDKPAWLSDLPPGTRSDNGEVRTYADGAVLAIDYVNGPVTASILQAWTNREGKWQLAAQQGVTIRGPVTPAMRPSAALPASSGPDADTQAIRTLIASMFEAKANGDVDAWAEVMTTTFVGTSTAGTFQAWDQARAEIAATGRQALPRVLQESIRVHGSFAVATLRVRSEPALEGWQTIVAVKNGLRWLVAASIMTPSTAATR